MTRATLLGKENGFITEITCIQQQSVLMEDLLLSLLKPILYIGFLMVFLTMKEESLESVSMESMELQEMFSLIVILISMQMLQEGINPMASFIFQWRSMILVAEDLMSTTGNKMS